MNEAHSTENDARVTGTMDDLRGMLERAWDEGAHAATMDYGIGEAVNPYRVIPPEKTQP